MKMSIAMFKNLQQLPQLSKILGSFVKILNIQTFSLEKSTLFGFEGFENEAGVLASFGLITSD